MNKIKPLDGASMIQKTFIKDQKQQKLNKLIEE